MCRVCKAIAFFIGALMMLNVGIASGDQSGFIPWRNAELCFEETVNAANGADPATLSTIYCTRALRDKPLGKSLGREDRSLILFNRGIIQKARGDLIAARASFDTAVSLSGAVDKRNLALAEVARELGDYSVALEQYDLLARSAFAVDSPGVRIALLERREEVGAGGIQVASFDKAQACGTCHGTNGISANPEIPTLAGRNENVLEHALRQFKDGDRQNSMMTAQAALIADEDVPRLARYFASLDGL